MFQSEVPNKFLVSKLKQPMIVVSRHGVHFGSSKYKFPLQQWQQPMLTFIPGNVTFDAVDSFVGMKGFAMFGGHIGKETIIREIKEMFASVNLSYFWGWHEIRFSLKGQVNSTTVHTVLRYDCEI